MFLGYVFVLLSAIGFGVLPIFTLYAYESDISIATLLFFRFTFTAIFFFIYLIASKDVKTPKKQLATFMLLGFLYAVCSTTYLLAVTYISPSVATLLFHLYPLVVAMMSFVIHKEALSKLLIVSIVMSFLGVSMVVGFKMDNLNMTGLTLSLASAIVYGAYIITSGQIVRQVSSFKATAYMSLFAAIFFLIGGLSSHTFSFHFDLQGWIWIGMITFICSILSIMMFFVGIERIGPTKASILSMIEPIVTILCAVFLFSDHLSFMQMIGVTVVLIGSILVVLSKNNDVELEKKDDLEAV